MPTDAPESDGTYAWDRTTLVVVAASAGGAAAVKGTLAVALVALALRLAAARAPRRSRRGLRADLR